MTPTSKSTTTPGSRQTARGRRGELTAAWEEARLVYPIYAALALQFDLGVPPYRGDELPEGAPPEEMFKRVERWLEELDERVRAQHVRRLHPATLNASPEGLRALILRLLKRPDKSPADRDKIDFLLTQYFALCAPEALYSREIRLGDVASVLRPVIEEADDTPLEWCEPLEEVLEKMKKCRSLGDVLGKGLVEQGRELKDQAGFMFYDPAALIAFTRFNFLLRRAFILLLHADLRAVREASTELERRGVKTVDCSKAGLSAAEPTGRLKEIWQEWRQPLPTDYSEGSAEHPFTRLLAIRRAVEESLARVKSGASPGSATTSPDARPGEGQPKASAPPPITASCRASQAIPKQPVEPEAASEEATTSASKQEGAPAPSNTKPIPTEPASSAPWTKTANGVVSVELENCLENIWEQLIAAPPARGRSMTTVVLDEVRVLLSSWEVAAFVSEGGAHAEDLRRAVAARAMVAVAKENLKRQANRSALDAALAMARAEVTFLQQRVEFAQRTKDTQAAVNLGISVRRLLSAAEEAEKS